MAIYSKFRGHDIYYDDGVWKFVSDDTLKSETYMYKSCGNCGKMPTKEGHDNCIANLKGITDSCCGHGIVKDAYVQFLDGFSIHGEDAIVIQNILKKYAGKE